MALDLYIDRRGENTLHLSWSTRSKSRIFSEDMDCHLNDILLSNQWSLQPYMCKNLLTSPMCYMDMSIFPDAIATVNYVFDEKMSFSDLSHSGPQQIIKLSTLFDF